MKMANPSVESPLAFNNKVLAKIQYISVITDIRQWPNIHYNKSIKNISINSADFVLGLPSAASLNKTKTNNGNNRFVPF